MKWATSLRLLKYSIGISNPPSFFDFEGEKGDKQKSFNQLIISQSLRGYEAAAWRSGEKAIHDKGTITCD
jgi:hypothetical protein